MLRRSLRLLSSAALTDSAATHSAGSRGLHRPRAAVQQQQRQRVRQRRQQRVRHVAAKAAEVQRSITGVTSSRDLLVGQLADQIFARGHQHVASATNIGFVPDGNPATPLVALAGRETCGKTSLLRSLFRSAREVGRSNRQLRRDAMNFFNVGDVFNVVDLPGCGGTSVPWSAVLQHAVLLRNFVRCQPSLKMLYYCMDVHYKNGVYIQDIDLLRFLSREVPNFTIVVTKADQINENTRHTVHMEDIRKELLYNDIHHPVLVTSAFQMGGVDTLRYDMVMNCLHALPTERLTLTESRRLSARLFSQTELSTIRPLAIAPTYVEDERREWLAEIVRTEKEVSTNGDAAVPHSGLTADTGGDLEGEIVREEVDETAEEGALSTSVRDEVLQEAALAYNDAEMDTFETSDGLAAPSLAEEGERSVEGAELPVALHCDIEATDKLPQLDASTFAVPTVFDSPVTQAAYARVVKTLRNTALLRYVEATSPWRNPLRWPRHVIPTKHPKANIMRCPEAPENPYLVQAQFVTPRADMCFRRPNVGVRKSAQKGKYEPDRPMAFLVKNYTIPYFPDIVDTAMQPTPWAILGSREAYFERSGGRQLGVRLLNYATTGTINPLSDNPAPTQPALTHEVRQLESKRYGAPIAMLKPPGTEGKSLPSLPPLPPPEM